nr:YhgE/Pip domain-containing protein [Demequina pelophila]
MRVPALLMAEFRRLTATPMAVVALIALMAVPLLYGGLYLWANRDPYAALDGIPAAIVVEDRGTGVDGATHDYGHEVAERLVTEGRFDWRIVTTDAALESVDAQDVDFAITFPADFSAALASAASDEPRQATVVLTTSDVNSYLASSIGKQAAETIRTAIAQAVNEEAAARFLLGFAEVRDSLIDAVDGASLLSDGAAAAHEGSTELADGATDARDGAAELADGSAAARDGAADLEAGVTRLASGSEDLAEGLEELEDGAGDLADGASQIAAGTATLAERADAAGDAMQQATDALPGIREELASHLAAVGLDTTAQEDLLTLLDPLADELRQGNERLQSAVEKVDNLADGADRVAQGAVVLASGAADAHDGSATLADGLTSAHTGTSDLAAGLATLAGGTDDLREGLDALDAGAHELESGLAAVADGSAELRDGLDEGLEELPDAETDLRTRQAATIADPLVVENDSLTSAGTYGAGLAPFFLSLAAWIGMYALFLIVKPVSRRAVTALRSPVRVTLAGWLVPGILGAGQMAALFAVVTWGLGFTFGRPWGSLGLLTLASLTFAAIILALNVWLGSVGQFLGLVLMVLQLVTAGGTFPWQTLPAPLAGLHPVLPMSYAVDGMRQLMYGGAEAAAWGDAAVLACWLGGALLVAAAGVTRMTHRRTLRDLRPSLIG